MQLSSSLHTIGTFCMASVLLVACTAEAPQEPDDMSAMNGDIVAVVNDETITREQYEGGLEQAEQNAAAQGQDVSDETFRMQLEQEVLERMITSVLVHQAAVESDVTVNEEDVEAEYQKITEQVGGTAELSAQLLEAGFTEELLREDLRKQMLVQLYVESQLATQDLTVTEEELTAFYDELSAAQEGMPPFEEIEEPLRAQLEQQKEQEFLEGLVAGLRADADIEILI